MASKTATKKAVANIGDELAKQAIELQRRVNALIAELDAKKEELRDFANGNNLEIVIDGEGKVLVAKPRAGSERTVLVLNDEKLNQWPEIKQKLIQREIVVENIKKTPAAKASVTIKPNV